MCLLEWYSHSLMLSQEQSYLRLAYWPDLLDEKPEDIVSHRDHCLDYIRQAIMCAGDVTFEPLDEAGVHGMGVSAILCFFSLPLQD